MESGESVKECRVGDAFKVACIDGPNSQTHGGAVNPVSIQPGSGYWESVGQLPRSGPIVVDSVCDVHRAELKAKHALSPGSS